MDWEAKYLNKVTCGDCLEGMKELPDESVDLVVTSPPYNLGIHYGNFTDNRSWKEYYEWCNNWLKEIYRVLCRDGRFCLIHYLSLGTSKSRNAPLLNLNAACEEIGFKHHALAIWWDITLTKLTAWGSWLSASAPYINSPFEGILILYKEHWKKQRTGKTNISKEEFMESCSGIWKISPEKNRNHPAPFPIKLASRCIKIFSWENDIVLDPFLGSGTTAVAAISLGRRYIGFEISPEYVKIANARIARAIQQITLDLN